MSTVVVEGLARTYHYRRRSRGLVGWFAGEAQQINAVAGIDFEVMPGERVAIIGPNGAGKSTTLKMLSGVLEPSSGTARVLGHVPWRERRALSYRIGVVFGQRSQLWGELPARASFDLLRRIYGVEASTFAMRLDELGMRFGLRELLDQPVNRLSLGQRMRCEIAASLLHGPELLFLDEPTIGLDVTAKAAIRDFILEHARDHGMTVLLTSHDTRDIELVCDRVIVINEGRIVVDQATDRLRQRYLGRKLVSIRSVRALSETTHDALSLPGIVQRSSAAHLTVLEVDTTRTRVDAVIAAAFHDGEVEDVSVEDPPLEEVIRDIYASAR